MAGEMTASEVTRENFPIHFAIADALGGTVHPFDYYQGPYIMVGGTDMRAGTGVYAVPLPTRITGGNRLWIVTADDECVELAVYNESNDRKSAPFPQFKDETRTHEFAVMAAREVVEVGA